MTTNTRRTKMVSCTMALAALMGLAAIPAAHAQKEMMGMFYSMQVAPKVCGWMQLPRQRLMQRSPHRKRALALRRLSARP